MVASVKERSASGSPRGDKLEKNGRNRGKYVALDHQLLNSNAYLALDPVSRCLLWEIARFVYGLNNGRMFLSVRDAAKLLGVFDDGTAARALQQLIDHGFLVVKQEAGIDFAMDGTAKTRARKWRATWLPTSDYRGKNKKPPTNDWRQWNPSRLDANRKAKNRRIERAREYIDRRLKNRIVEGKFPEVVTIDPINSTISDGNFPEVTIENGTIVENCSEGKFPTYSYIMGRDNGRAHVAPSQLDRIRQLAIAWMVETGSLQKHLAGQSGIDPAKLSRFLNDTSGRKSLTPTQVRNIERVIGLRESWADQIDNNEIQHQPKKSVA